VVGLRVVLTSAAFIVEIVCPSVSDDGRYVLFTVISWLGVGVGSASSDDGQHVAFGSEDQQLIPGGTPSGPDLWSAR